MSATTTTEKKQKAAPVKVWLDEASEATSTKLRDTVKADGTRLWALAKGIDTIMRDIQDRLNRDGKAVQVLGALGSTVTLPIEANVNVEFVVKAGDKTESFQFTLRPGPHSEPTPPEANKEA